MDESDKQIVEAVRAWLESGAGVPEPILHNLVALLGVVDRLDAENEKLKTELDRAVDALVKS